MEDDQRQLAHGAQFGRIRGHQRHAHYERNLFVYGASHGFGLAHRLLHLQRAHSSLYHPVAIHHDRFGSERISLHGLQDHRPRSHWREFTLHLERCIGERSSWRADAFHLGHALGDADHRRHVFIHRSGEGLDEQYLG